MLTVGEKVKDTWFDDWGVGVCIKALKTVWYIKFTGNVTRKYDRPHLKFLKTVS